MAPKVDTVNRKVYFFRLAHAMQSLPEVASAVSRIDELPFNENGRYLSVNDEDNLLSLYVDSRQFPLKLHFGRIRRNNLPLIEHGGKFQPLSLRDGAGLIDGCHIVLFSDGIVAAELNQDGPRLRRLGPYLQIKGMTQQGAPKFLPLYQKDIIDELDRLQSITLLELEIKATDTDLIARADEHLGAAFSACRDAGSSSKTRLVLSATRTRNEALRSLVKRLFINDDSRKLLKRFYVKGQDRPTSQPRGLDLLEEYLVSSQIFIRRGEKSKAIDSEHAYDVIEQAYEENYHRFESAAAADDQF